MRDDRVMRIDIVVFDGFDELDALGPYEVLRNAQDAGCAADVALCSMDEAVTEVTGSHGARVGVQRALGPCDLVVVPGGGWNDRAPRGARAEAERGELPRRLAALHADGATVAGVCTGGMLLAAAGLMTGRPATTHHAAREELRATRAEVVDARVVDDGDILTCGGVTSGLDLALWLVERHWGGGLAAAIAGEMEHERRGPVRTPDGRAA